MKIDLHVHSTYSHDCSTEPKDIIKKCRDLGLDGICFTEHHSYKASSPVDEIKESGIKVFRGAEAATSLGHILVFGVKDDSWNTWDGVKGNFMDVQKLIDYVNSMGGVSILAHPFRKEYPINGIAKLYGLTALEVYNGKNSIEQTLRTEQLRRDMNLRATGGSDAHCLEDIGKCYTVFEKEINNTQELVNELKEARYYGRNN